MEVSFRELESLLAVDSLLQTIRSTKAYLRHQGILSSRDGYLPRGGGAMSGWPYSLSYSSLGFTTVHKKTRLFVHINATIFSLAQSCTYQVSSFHPRPPPANLCAVDPTQKGQKGDGIGKQFIKRRTPGFTRRGGTNTCTNDILVPGTQVADVHVRGESSSWFCRFNVEVMPASPYPGHRPPLRLHAHTRPLSTYPSFVVDLKPRE